MPQHGAAIFYSHPPSSVNNNMRQTGQQMHQMLFEGLPNIPLTIVTFKPRNTYMPTCINLLSVELSGQNKRQTMFVEMSIRLPFVNKWIRRTRRNSFKNYKFYRDKNHNYSSPLNRLAPKPSIVRLQLTGHRDESSWFRAIVKKTEAKCECL